MPDYRIGRRQAHPGTVPDERDPGYGSTGDNPFDTTPNINTINPDYPAVGGGVLPWYSTTPNYTTWTPPAGTAGAAAGAATGGGGLTAATVIRLLQMGIPLATILAQRGGGVGANGLTPELQGQLNALMALSRRRLERSEPVHEAAVRLAMGMSGGVGNSPRLQRAIASAGAPPPNRELPPQVGAALARLMGR